jgi:hypothetical protein
VKTKAIIDDYRAADAEQHQHRERYNEAGRRKANAIRDLRDAGLTWVEIGKLLGISSQRAQKITQRP